MFHYQDGRNASSAKILLKVMLYHVVRQACRFSPQKYSSI
uniref:Uncharacterized protein n=1 Tax=Siphoviridae sp. ct2u94 TaxID=2826277 RepID=A0A8S5QUN8_9CAUD|nr:MAG TPA: hypothetical protein [Siphoviridae sp. ct2u94]